MSSASASSAGSTGAATIAAGFAGLNEHAAEWFSMTAKDRLGYLLDVRDRLESHFFEMTEAAYLQRSTKKDDDTGGEIDRVDPNFSAAMGASVSIMGLCLNDYIQYYTALAGENYVDGEDKQAEEEFVTPTLPLPMPVRELQDGRKCVEVFPKDALERALAGGDRVEVYLDKASRGQVRSLGAEAEGNSPGVRCVLMPGNYEGNFDLLQSLFVDRRVVMAKTHPVSEEAAVVSQKIFGKLVDDGFLCFTEGGIPEAQACLAEESLADAMLTGNHLTYDAIVWGPAEGREERKARGDKVFDKPMIAAGGRRLLDCGAG